MSDYPDWSPPPNLAYPTTPANYVNVGINVFLNSTTPAVLKHFTDSKLYLLKYLAFNGTLTRTSAGGFSAINVTMQLTQGLNNGGVATVIAGVGSTVRGEDGSSLVAPQWVFAEVPGPLVFRAGTVGTPNDLSISADTGAAALFFQGYAYGLLWPLN